METKPLIFTKIPAIMALVGVVGKNRKNTMQGYQFRGIDDMYNALNEHLANEKVFVTSEVLSKDREERPSKQGGVLLYTVLTMKFRFYAEDGSSVESVTVGEAMDSGDKSANKAMSTAYKYALMQIFCIPTEEDKDTETHSPEVGNKQTPIETPKPVIRTTQDFIDSKYEDEKEPSTTRELAGVIYTYRKGIGKESGKPYEGYFPPKGSNAKPYWSVESFEKALMDMAAPDIDPNDLPF